LFGILRDSSDNLVSTGLPQLSFLKTHLSGSSLAERKSPSIFLVQPALRSGPPSSWNGGFPFCELGGDPANQKVVVISKRTWANQGIGPGALSRAESVSQTRASCLVDASWQKPLGLAFKSVTGRV
jgi:hypothetical protein